MNLLLQGLISPNGYPEQREKRIQLRLEAKVAFHAMLERGETYVDGFERNLQDHRLEIESASPQNNEDQSSESETSDYSSSASDSDNDNDDDELSSE
jgi:hypothetical protein